MATRKPAGTKQSAGTSAAGSGHKKTRSHNSGSDDTSTTPLGSRAQLIDATLRIILERGIDAVRVDDIVAEVGVTKGSLYWHFEDRQGLIKAAIAEQINRFSAETITVMSEAIAGSATKEDYLARVVPFIVDPFDAKQVRDRWGRLSILVETQNDPELKAMMHDVQSRHLEVVVELMSDAQKHGYLREDLDPRSVAVVLSVINLGSNIIDVLAENGPDPADWWNLIGFFVNAMFPPES